MAWKTEKCRTFCVDAVVITASNVSITVSVPIETNCENFEIIHEKEMFSKHKREIRTQFREDSIVVDCTLKYYDLEILAISSLHSTFTLVREV